MSPRGQQRREGFETGATPEGAEGLDTATMRGGARTAPAPSARRDGAAGRAGEAVVYLSGDAVGGGGEHGRALMRAFLYALAETAPQPKAVIMVGEAVRLARPGAETFEPLSLMQEQGVSILLAEDSVRALGGGEKIPVGRPATMHAITGALLRAEKVIAL